MKRKHSYFFNNRNSQLRAVIENNGTSVLQARPGGWWVRLKKSPNGLPSLHGSHHEWGSALDGVVCGEPCGHLYSRMQRIAACRTNRNQPQIKELKTQNKYPCFLPIIIAKTEELPEGRNYFPDGVSKGSNNVWLSGCPVGFFCPREKKYLQFSGSVHRWEVICNDVGDRRLARHVWIS